ncbi:cupin domain-containing protein [Halalkalibacillus halophilus]|uniref:cupin domain-containing protein n=1 Tax=Halalkalibacillus halophilus TaxID=392827 RepID=UPI0004109116|nr:cupin domain-containing protein [Halalkalibacillus halophilus]
MTNQIDYTSPSVQYFFNMNNSHLFVKDRQNLINVAGQAQLNSLQHSSLLDIFLSRGNVVEPHYHQNASEIVYCISGQAEVSLLNPFTKEYLHFCITPGQIVNIPQGWWHYIVALEDHTHLLAVFDAANPEVVLGSDILALTPANVMAHTYCMNEEEWVNVTAPIKPSTYIGPYSDCKKDHYMGYNNQHHPSHYSYSPNSHY